MLIRKVELENIKNYEASTFEFEGGVTAINGPNGAGKTTILEAIAYVLFDYLPYRKEDFVKRGAKKGTARITFVSAIDGREYTVCRDTSTSYFVFDPITKARLVEQKGQVTNWIREHLGVEIGTDLKTLFTSSIGVPQGTFTVDFAEQPARRKICFDKVLRVDEYQGASDEIRGVLRYIDLQDARIKEEIARYVGEISTLDNLLAERVKREVDNNNLSIEVTKTERIQSTLREEIDELEKSRQKIEQITKEKFTLETQLESLDRQRSPLLEEVRLGELAEEAVKQASAGYQMYLEATDTLLHLEPKAIKRDELKKTSALLEREHYRLAVLQQTLKEKLDQIIEDKKAIENMTPLVEKQLILESRRQDLQGEITELKILKVRSEKDEKELNALRNEYLELIKRLEETEKHREIAALVPALEEQKETFLKKLREAEISYERFILKQKEAKRSSDTLAKLAAEIKTLEGELANTKDYATLIAGLPQLEAQGQVLLERSTALRLNIEREETIRSEIKDGMCPLLSQRCLNIKDGQGLDQFFSLQLTHDREQLELIEASRIEIQQKIGEARHAERMSSAVAAHQTQLARFKQDYELELRSLSRLEKELVGEKIEKGLLIKLNESLENVDQQLKLAHSAKVKYERVEVIQERLEVLKREGRDKREAFEEVMEKLSKLDLVTTNLLRVEEDLVMLNDPKGRRNALISGIEKEADIRAALEKGKGEEQQVLNSLAESNKELIAFLNLDEQIVECREKRAANAKDHQLYVENYPIASKLKVKQEGLRAIESRILETKKNLEGVHELFRTASIQYDTGRHEEVRRSLDETIHKLGYLTSKLNETQRRLEELHVEIERLLVMKNRMEELVEEQNRWQNLYTTSDMIRDLLKKAGPFITESHLQAVSIEANQLYREVTGNPMATLKWDAGYEVMLEEEGHERPFVNLSGGEQMSAALSIRLALLKELSEIRIAFFDEPTTNLDEERRRNLAQQIGRIKDFHQLFIISHDDAFEGFTDRVILLGVN